MTTSVAGSPVVSTDRLLVVGRHLREDRALMDQLRERYEHWSVESSGNYLSAIVSLSNEGATAVLAAIDPSVRRLEEAVGAMREAAGPDTRIILCATPEQEPLARRLLECGADDYVLEPVDTADLDPLLGRAPASGGVSAGRAGSPTASMAELDELARVMGSVEDSPRVVLERLAGLVRDALGARGVMVVAEGATGTSGEPVRSPVLAVPLIEPVKGQIAVSEREHGPYTPGDTEKLSRYAAIASRLLQVSLDQRRWRQLALTDECTGLPNRRFVHQRLETILAEAAERRLQVTLLFFDVDDFKFYNDEFGHDAGDEILREMGELFRRHLREHDIVARYGGDEFAVVFWDQHGPRVAGSRHPDSALDVLDRFKAALQSHTFPKLGPGRAGKLTISGGLATFPWDGTTAADLTKAADEALLSAKRAGKNRVFVVGRPDGE